jgi:hypothetical protein
MDNEGYSKLNDYVSQFMAATSGQLQSQPSQSTMSANSTKLPERPVQVAETSGGSEEWSPACKRERGR